MNSHVIPLHDYAASLGMTAEELLGKSRKPIHSTARQAYWRYMQTIGCGYSAIARMFNRDHVTIKCGINRINDLLYTGDEVAFVCATELLRKNENNFSEKVER